MIVNRWLGIALVFVFAVSGQSRADTRTVALSGVPAQGLGASRYGAFTSPPVLNDQGKVAFVASIANSSTTGVWSEGGGSGLHLVTTSGATAPATPTNLRFESFGHLVINNPGQVAVEATISGPGLSAPKNYGLWITDPSGQLQFVARDGAAPPGVPPGVVMDAFLDTSYGSSHASWPVLNDVGQTAFDGIIAGPGISDAARNREGLWSTTSGAVLAPIAIARDKSAGSAGGVDFISFGQPTLNNHGLVAFVGYHAPNGGPYGPYFANPGSNVTPIALTGQILPKGGELDDVSAPPKVNDAGDVAIWGDSSGRFGIWTKRFGGDFEQIASEGQPAPGLPAGIVFAGLWAPSFNAQSRVAFDVRLDGPGVNNSNRFGICYERPSGGVTLAARTGDPAPGLSGMVFTALDDNVAFNGRGQVAFLAAANPDTSAFGQVGIWATDDHGALKSIAFPGQMIDVDNGPGADLRTIASVNMVSIDSFNGGTGNQDGLPSAFNELGQIAFSVVFIDGSQGVFVSNLVAVPEPRTLMLVIVGALAVAARGRNKNPRQTYRASTAASSSQLPVDCAD